MVEIYRVNQRFRFLTYIFGINFDIFKYIRRKLYTILLLCILPFFYFFFLKISVESPNDEVGNEANNDIDIQMDVPIDEKSLFDEKAPIFMTAICEGDTDREVYSLDRLANNVHRQIQQTIVLIKSAAVLTTSFINIIIAVDKDYLYDEIADKIESWPKDILSKFSLQRRTVWFPEGSDIKASFRVCSSARLFFPEHMTDIDSAVYVDTDVLFLRSPEDLWREFNNFNSVQMCGLTGPEFYDFTSKMPYYGRNGLNGGVWLMNMTRMRNFPGGWEKLCRDTYKEYKEYVTYADQDIGNIIFNKYPQYVYELDCQWNIRSRLCKYRSHLCPEVIETGAFLLHGNEFTFFRKDLKTTVMYDGWKNFKPGGSLVDLLNSFKESLQKVDITKPGFCSLVDGYDDALIKGLEDHIKKLEHGIN